MKTGDIIVVAFPFSDQNFYKNRPAVVVNSNLDAYGDIIVCLISSVVPAHISSYEIILEPDQENKLRALSVLKVNRIATVEKTMVKAVIGSLSEKEKNQFKQIFQSLVE